MRSLSKSLARLHGAAILAALLFLAAAPAQAALVGWWDFNGTLNDASGNGNTGTNNGASFSNDVPAFLGAGQSMSFPGGASHVLVNDSASLDITGAITIAAWVKPVGNVGWDGILAKNPSDGSTINHAGNYEFRIENGSRVPTFHHQRGGFDDTAAYSGSAAVTQGAWSHVAVTAVNGGLVKFYVNGIPAGTGAVSGLFGATNSNPLYIGSRADLFTTMDGLLDDVRLYNEELSHSAIAALAGADISEHPAIANVLARASSEFLGDGRLAAHTVNGGGLVGKQHVDNPPGGTMWLTNGADPTPEFELDLGGTYDLTSLRIWNYNENANPSCCLGRGISSADIYVAGADGVYSAVPLVAGQAFSIAPGTFGDFSQLVNLPSVKARYIKLDNIINHGDASFTGLSEARVDGDGVRGQAPEPATIHSVSSNLSGFNRIAQYTINRTGAGFSDTHTIAPEGAMWLSQGTFPTSPTPDVAPEITFDLGALIELDRMKVWNYNEIVPGDPSRDDELLGRGIDLAFIQVAGDDLSFSPLGIFSLARAPGQSNVDFGQLIDMGGILARYVKIQALTNHNGRDFTEEAGDDGFFNFAGLSEVQFFAVPEPSSLALAGLGAVLAIVAIRRRAVGRT